MEQINYTNEESLPVKMTVQTEPIIVEANQMPNSVLQRLIEEVKNDNANHMFAYDRAHNRHNRGK